jgi:hypothetical protein
MNRCLKHLLVKNLNNYQNIILKDEIQRSTRILTILNRYSFFSKSSNNINYDFYGQQKRNLTRERLKSDKNNSINDKNQKQHQNYNNNKNRKLTDSDNKKPKTLEDLIKPVEVQPSPKLEEDIGTEFCGEISKSKISSLF